MRANPNPATRGARARSERKPRTPPTDASQAAGRIGGGRRPAAHAAAGPASVRGSLSLRARPLLRESARIKGDKAGVSAQHMRRRHRTCVHRRARAAPVALARAVLRDSTGRPLSTNIIVRVTPQAASRPQSSWGRGRGRRRRASAPDSSPSALPWPGSQLLVLSTARRHLDVLKPMHAEAKARAQSWERAWGRRRSAPGSSASPCSSPAGTDVAPLRLP